MGTDKNKERRVPVGFLERNLVHGDFLVATSQTGRFFELGRRSSAAPPDEMLAGRFVSLG
jgi:hypothetical protein